MQEGLLRCDSALRVVSEKPHQEVYTSVTDKWKFLSKLRRLGMGKGNRLGERKSVVVRPRVPAGGTKEFEYLGYHLNFTFRLEERLFEDEFREYASDGPHVYGGGVGGRAE